MKIFIVKKVYLTLILLFFLCLTSPYRSAYADNRSGDIRANAFSASISDGEDLSFPVDIPKSKYCGIFQMSGMPSPEEQGDLAELIDCYGATHTWNEMNPAENEYDFSGLLFNLQVAEQNGKCLIIRLKNHVVKRTSTPQGPFIPQWVLVKHDPQLFYTDGGSIQVAAPWNQGVTDEYKKFIAEFGKQGILNNPVLKGVYVHGFSTSVGEEMWLSSTGAKNAVAAGMTQETLKSAYEARFRAWADAAEEHIGKMTWVGSGYVPIASENYYHDARDYLDKLAADLGLGYRTGGMENYDSAFKSAVRASLAESSYSPLLYDTATEKVYRNTEWGFRDFKRYIGGEDEQYNTSTEYDEAFKSTVWVESLQGTGFLWIPGKDKNDFIRRNRNVLDWFSLRSGKSISQSPDAALWLRENCIVREGDRKIKNIELGLSQTDGTGSTTVPVESYGKSDCGTYEYLARRTDTATGNSMISFKIDEAFKNTLKGSVLIKIIYLDNSLSQWRLVTSSNNSSTISNTNDGKIKTANVELTAIDLQSTFPDDNADFKLEVLNSDDLTVRIVRVVKYYGLGDIDHSGQVDLKDVISALQVCAGLSPMVFPVSSVDGQVGLKDALYGLRTVAGLYINN